MIDGQSLILFLVLIFFLKLLIQNHIEFDSNQGKYETFLKTIHLDYMNELQLMLEKFIHRPNRLPKM